MKLKELRKQKKITQKDLGDLLGNTPPTTVSSWERGQSKPRMDVAAKIAKILNTSVSNLMEDELENYSNVYSKISNSSLSLPIYSHL
ncbi:helix-turn-helix transcriptional regulator, partial [Oenococcus oeni]